MEVLNLTTEYKINPIGIDTLKPRFNWKIMSKEQNVLQTAYQIKVAKSVDDLNKSITHWDSGKISSDQSIHVEYKGPDLKSFQRLYWQVTVWDNKGNSSTSNEIAFWEMGILSDNEWVANWIFADIDEDKQKSNPCPYFRKSIQIEKDIKEARIYVSALGLYEINLNGKKVGNELFTPGWTSYSKRIQYQVYDVSDQLNKGENAIGTILGDGWYCGFLAWQGEKNTYGDKIALIMQLKITYQDGSEKLIITDETWKYSKGPILKSDIYNGEVYNANLELTGWDKLKFNDQNWLNVKILNHPRNILIASEGVPVKITKTIKPIKKIKTPKGETVFDLGQNIVGWVKFSLKGKKGEKITLKHAEVLDKEGSFYTENLRDADCTDQYIFKGKGVENFEPHFTFHGFRYIKIEDFPGEINVDDIEGKVIHSDMKPIGEFECSDPLINQLQKNIQWGLRGNFLDVPTDCPQRDERLGWTGDAQVFASTANFIMNTSSFYTKWMKDFITDQKDDGSIPWVVPNVIKNGGGTGWSDGYGATGWADAAVIIPWEVYKTFGDKRILEYQYESMKAWIEYMIKHAGDRYIFDYGFHFGDWLSFAEYYSYKYNAPDYGYAGAHTEKDLIATAYFYYSTTLMQKIALIVGNDTDAKKYKKILPKIKSAFQKEFLTQTGRLTSGTQTAYLLALSFGLIPDEMKNIAAKNLADDVEHFGHLTTGFLGTPLLCHTLTENGYPELAYQLLFNNKYPSWLFPVTMDATTIWERWDGIKPDGTFQNAGMNSFNHYAYGAVGNWLYTKVAGLNIDEEKPGYKNIIIKPFVTKKLKYAKVKYNSIYGNILSHWYWENNKLNLEIHIPPNTKASIYFPDNYSSITINNKAISKIKEIKILETKQKIVITEIGSGDYNFELT